MENGRTPQGAAVIEIAPQWVMYRPVVSPRKPLNKLPYMVHDGHRWKRVLQDDVGMYFTTLKEKIYVTFDTTRFPK